MDEPLILTRDDIIRAGACIEKVDVWCFRNKKYVCEYHEALDLCTSDEQEEYIKRAAKNDGYGSGSGYGYADGYGDGLEGEE